MFVNFKRNMCCNNNNIFNDSKTNSKYGNLNFESNNNYDYKCNCDKVEVIVTVCVEVRIYTQKQNGSNMVGFWK